MSFPIWTQTLRFCTTPKRVSVPLGEMRRTTHVTKPAGRVTGDEEIDPKLGNELLDSPRHYRAATQRIPTSAAERTRSISCAA